MLDPALRSSFTTFLDQLVKGAKARELGVIVGVPVTEAANDGAYDWRALATTADALWVRGPESPDQYYGQLEQALRSAREAAAAVLEALR